MLEVADACSPGKSFAYAQDAAEPSSRAIGPAHPESGVTGRPWRGQRQDGLTTAEHEERRRLRRGNRALREEREILENAAAWCLLEQFELTGAASTPPTAQAGEPGVVAHPGDGRRRHLHLVH